MALIRWPSDEALRVELAQLKHPRLLLIEPHADPPHVSDILEDWVRLPVSREDRNARIRVLEHGSHRGCPMSVTTEPSIIEGRAHICLRSKVTS